MYFFVISFAGLDANGNAIHKVTGFKQRESSNAYDILTQKQFKEILDHGRWNSKTYSIRTQLSVAQIKEYLDKNLNTNYNYVIV